MRVANRWRDYTLLDCSEGRRLERWGSFSVIRPDPQVVWKSAVPHPAWRQADAVYLRSRQGGGHWSPQKGTQLPGRFPLSYGDLKFWVGPTNFKHMGLFPEQATNWDLITERIQKADRPLQVLNLFAYTGGATLAAAAAGAHVCHVDAARGMVSWARDNAALSGLSHFPIRYIVDDCREFVAREIRRGRRYDLLIMDPPSFGRGPDGDVWKMEENIYDFLSLCAGVLSDNPAGVFLNAYTTGLSPAVLTCLLQSLLIPRFGGQARAQELGLPIGDSGMILPCGATGQWNP